MPIWAFKRSSPFMCHDDDGMKTKSKGDNGQPWRIPDVLGWGWLKPLQLQDTEFTFKSRLGSLQEGAPYPKGYQCI